MYVTCRRGDREASSINIHRAPGAAVTVCVITFFFHFLIRGHRVHFYNRVPGPDGL